MAGSGGGFLGKLLTFFLGMIFGMIVLVGGIAGGAYWAYSNVKLSQIEKQFKRDLFGDDYKDDTIKQFVSKLSGIGSSMTIGEIEGVFKFINDEINKRYPDGTIPINLSGDTPLGRIDLNVLRQSTIGGVQGALSNVFVITATLRLTESLGIELPDLPMIKGGGAGAEYYIYTLATDDDYSILSAFSGFTEFYVQEMIKKPVVVEDGKITGEFRYMDEFFNDTNDEPVDNTDGILNDSPPPYDLYIKTYSYSDASIGDIGNEPLYVRTDGIIDLPLIEGFNTLSAMFDFDTLTLNDMQDKFGFTLGANFMIDKIKDVPLSKLSQGINDEIDNIELKEIINNDVGSTVINALLYDEDGNPVKVGGIAARVDELKLGDVIGIDDVTSPKIMVALKNYKLDELSDAINNLAIEQIVEIPADNNILNSIKHATLATLPDVLNDLTLQDIVGTDIYDMVILAPLEIAAAYFDVNTDIYILDGTVYIKIDKQEYFDETGDLKAEYLGTDLYVKGDVKPSIWRYIVMDNVDGVMTEVPVSINNIATRMDNVAANINSSPLGELHANGVITLDDISILGKKFPMETLTLGEMTITQIINKLSTYVS